MTSANQPKLATYGRVILARMFLDLSGNSCYKFKTSSNETRQLPSFVGVSTSFTCPVDTNTLRNQNESGADMVNGSNGASLNSGNVGANSGNATQPDQKTQLDHNLSGFTANIFAGQGTKGPSTTNSKEHVSFSKLVTGEPIYGFFLGKRIAYLVVENYVKNTWSNYGLVKSMMNSANGLFFFKFNSKDGMDAMLENDTWFIHDTSLILKRWTPDANLLKEDVGNVSVWVKFHNVPITAFSENGLSFIATKLGTPFMLNYYTCARNHGVGHVLREQCLS
ncbi:hypothetical protein Tco_1403373 [Tanacetum coccineum]